MANDKSYPDIHKNIQKLMGELKREIPSVMEGFGKLHHAAVADGALDPKSKELISLGIAISVRCEGCISFHVHDAVKAGATRAEIVETIGVAILMGGGPSLMYGVEAYEALGQFEAALGAG
jgi:AhpD family alkylhydroperoxidase